MRFRRPRTGLRGRLRVIRKARRNARMAVTGHAVFWVAGLGAVAAVVTMELAGVR